MLRYQSERHYSMEYKSLRNALDKPGYASRLEYIAFYHLVYDLDEVIQTFQMFDAWFDQICKSSNPHQSLTDLCNVTENCTQLPQLIMKILDAARALNIPTASIHELEAADDKIMTEAIHIRRSGSDRHFFDQFVVFHQRHPQLTPQDTSCLQTALAIVDASEDPEQVERKQFMQLCNSLSGTIDAVQRSEDVLGHIRDVVIREWMF